MKSTYNAGPEKVAGWPVWSPGGCWLYGRPSGMWAPGPSSAPILMGHHGLAPNLLSAQPLSAPWSVGSPVWAHWAGPLHLFTIPFCSLLPWDFCSRKGKISEEDPQSATRLRAFLPGCFGGQRAIGGAEAGTSEKGWEGCHQEATAWAGDPETSLLLRLLRAEEVWERKLLCKHRGFCLYTCSRAVQKNSSHECL